MKITKELSIEKPAADVWEVLGTQFGEIDKWASIIHKSEVSGKPTVPGATFSIRSTETTGGPTKQELLEYDAEKFIIAYKAIAGTPFFIKSIFARWTLETKGDESTKLVLDFSFETKGLLGILLAPIAKNKLTKVGDELLDDFKFYVENGQPHARKLAAMKN